MRLFLTEHERMLLHEQHRRDPVNRFYWALLRRVEQRVQSPGLINPETGVHWWHAALEYVSDAAMSYAIKPQRDTGIWLRDVVLSLVRRSTDDWIGPWFRNHTAEPPRGHLETAHLSAAVAIALDLAPDAFTVAERDEISAKLRDEAIPLCLRYLDGSQRLNNWTAIMTFGVATAAAVLDDQAAMQQAVDYFNLSVQAFQPDGSHSESLQYANYMAMGLMLSYEALTRRTPALAAQLSVEAYARSVPWMVTSYFYQKPLPGWGMYPLPRSANFNDSSAIYRPAADVLLHIAVRGHVFLPAEAALARWLFDELYPPYAAQAPYDRMTFGFFNHFGFLTLPLLVQAPAAISPQAANLPVIQHYSCGDTLVRVRWGGRTTLAIRGAGDALHGPAHLHGDLNSFILVHNNERLLLDPGHSCYRGLLRELDITSSSHNTCTFMVETDEHTGTQAMVAARTLQQAVHVKRPIVDGQLAPPAERGGKHLLAAEVDNVRVVGSDAGSLYGPTIETFARFFVLCGEHALFIVDHIISTQPVRTTWHWLLNNRDGALDVKTVPPDRLVARRGDAGLKLFHLGGGHLHGPLYGYVHDAYHPLPDQLGEGRPGSGLLFRWQEPVAATQRIVIHAIAVDHYGAVAGWHLRETDGCNGLESPDGDVLWTVDPAHEQQAALTTITVREERGAAAYHITHSAGQWTFSASE